MDSKDTNKPVHGVPKGVLLFYFLRRKQAPRVLLLAAAKHLRDEARRQKEKQNE